MDFEYGCATVNKFAFLDENEVEDPSDLLAQVAIAKDAAAKVAKETKKVDSKGKKVDPKKGKDTKKPLQSSDNAVKKSGDSKDSGKKQFGDRREKPAGDLAKENRGPRQDRRPRQEGEAGGFRNDRPPRQDGDRPPRRPQGEGGYRQDRPPRQNRQVDADGNVIESAEGEGFRGGYRGPRGGTGYRGPRGPRREGGENEGEVRRFDRHSGSEKTGIKAVDKKDGAGKGNWGTATDEDVIEETMGQAVEGETKDWAERVDENDEKKEGDVPEEDTPNFMTLEEYKALKSQINKRNDFNIRRPGEGEDQSKWGKTYLLPKKADEEDEEDEEEEDEDEEDDEPEDVQKKELIKSMQSAFKFESTNVPDRRGERGDRGRGGPRGSARGGERRDGERREYRKPEGDAPSDSPVTETAPTDAAAAPESTEKKTFERRPQGDRPQRGGQQGGRGGRGSGRPGPSGRGAQKSAPKFDDEKDFPTLGK